MLEQLRSALMTLEDVKVEHDPEVAQEVSDYLGRLESQIDGLVTEYYDLIDGPRLGFTPQRRAR